MNKNMMRQAQRLQAQLQKIQEELETLTVEGSSGGGVVKVVMTGKQVVQKVTIAPSAGDALIRQKIQAPPASLMRVLDWISGAFRPVVEGVRRHGC